METELVEAFAAALGPGGGITSLLAGMFLPLPQGRVIFLRRTTEAGATSLLGHTFPIDPLWPHRLVRCEVDLQGSVIRVYALRRREPADQPLLRELPYTLPTRPFRE